MIDIIKPKRPGGPGWTRLPNPPKKERPILFSSSMVRALLAGQKTQTRRIVKPQPETMRDPFPTTPETMMTDSYSSNRVFKIEKQPGIYRCLGMQNFVQEFSPYGQPGDRLYVRETWAEDKGATGEYESARQDGRVILYRADDHGDQNWGIPYLCADGCVRFGPRPNRWKPSIHMPRAASRITLEITGVRVERLQDISEADCWAEGIDACDGLLDDTQILALAKRMNRPFEDAAPTYAALWESINGPGSWDANPWVWVIEFKRLEQTK